jgi:hypothetical protein
VPVRFFSRAHDTGWTDSRKLYYYLIQVVEVEVTRYALSTLSRVAVGYPATGAAGALCSPSFSPLPLPAAAAAGCCLLLIAPVPSSIWYLLHVRCKK